MSAFDKIWKLYDALDLISKGITRPTKIAKALDVDYKTFRNWLVRSNRGDPLFMVEVDGEQMQFAKAVTLATKLALFELRGMVLQEAIYGYDEIQVFQGQPVWAIDPRAAAMSEVDREIFGYRKDALLEIGGKLQPVVIKHKAPFAQQIRLLEAAFPDLRPTQTINSNVALSGTVGVGVAPRADYSKGPPEVPPPPQRPQLAAPTTDAEFSEVDDDLEDLLGPEPQPAPVNVNINVELAVETPRVETDRTIRDLPTEREKIAPATPPTQRAMDANQVPLRAPRNDLERDLFAKLAAKRAQTS